MNSGMRVVTNALALAVLLSSAGCRAEMSEARRNHVLAGDHGWIDLTLKSAPKSAAYDPKKNCTVWFNSNGETQYSESADLEHAANSENPFGYRIVAPIGKTQAELTLSNCIAKPLVVKLPFDLAKDHLVRLAFDGTALVLESSTPYEPTSLEWVRAEMLKLQSNNASSDEAVARLTKLAFASLGLNLLALLVFIISRRRSPQRQA